MGEYLRVVGRPGRMDALEALHEEIRAHRGCGFEICEQATQLVPGEGDPRRGRDARRRGARALRRTSRAGRSSGGPGQLLDELLGEAGLERAEVFITNVVKARPPGNRDPKAPEVAHHLPWLEQQLALVAPRVVIPLGRHALSHFAPGAEDLARSTGSWWWMATAGSCRGCTRRPRSTTPRCGRPCSRTPERCRASWSPPVDTAGPRPASGAGASVQPHLDGTG